MLKTTTSIINASQITGTLPVANGGTGLTSYTANGVIYASSSSVLASGSGLTFDGTNLTVNGATSTGRVTAKLANIAGFQSMFSVQNATNTGQLASIGLNISTDEFTLGSDYAAQVVFKFNALEKLRLISTGVSVTGALTTTGTISPVQATTAGAPAYVKGAMYFDTTLNKLRIGGATGWETVTSV